MRFEFATSARVVFGWGVSAELGKAASELGRRALVVTGSSPERAAGLLEVLGGCGVQTLVRAVSGEPTTAQARAAAAEAKQQGCELVIAIGGGGALDAGKAVAALSSNSGEPLDYLEVVGAGRALEHAPLPFIAVPTTAGTGSEVTRNAVLASPEHGVKASMRSERMLPRLALIDPQLCSSMPAVVTACTGLDALTQLIEPYVSSRANPLVDALCRDGIARVAGSLQRACEQPRERQARTDMSLASVLGGMALANAGLGAAHGLAAVLGGMLPASHGALCARLLGPVIRANAAALRQRAPDNPALQRYAEVAVMLTGEPLAGPEDAALWVESFCEAFAIPGASSWGLGAEQLEVVASRAASASSMKANPIALSADELKSVLRALL
jgi:alcohol dehydrogenase class IV